MAGADKSEHLNGNGAAHSPSLAALRARRYRARKKAERKTSAAAITGGGVAPTVLNVTASVTTIARNQPWLGVMLIAVAAGLTVTGAAMTVTYASAGGDGYQRLPLGIIAVSADAVALLMPAAAAALWISRRRLLAVAAVALWVVSTAITLTNLAGFVGISGDHFIAGRETALTQRDLTLERVARLRAERARITETRPAGVIVLAIANATKAHVDDERAALAIAKRRDVLDTELAAVAPAIATLPAVGAADPAAGAITGALRALADITVAPEAVTRLRVLLLVALPMCAGPIMAIGLGLLRANGR